MGRKARWIIKSVYRELCANVFCTFVNSPLPDCSLITKTLINWNEKANAKELFVSVSNRSTLVVSSWSCIAKCYSSFIFHIKSYFPWSFFVLIFCSRSGVFLFSPSNSKLSPHPSRDISPTDNHHLLFRFSAFDKKCFFILDERELCRACYCSRWEEENFIHDIKALI